MNMEILPALIWFLIGLFCMITEFYAPGLILIFFGIGAWIVAFIVAITDMGIILQLLIFLFISVTSLLLLRNRFMKKEITTIDVTDDFIGKTAIVQEAFSKEEFGKVLFKGASWRARTDSDELMKPGECVRIVGRESIVLKIKSITKKETES